MRCSSFILFFVLLAIPSTCFSWPAKVVSIADGDTITVLHQGQRKEIRLYGIDCPEKGQDQGEQAKALTSALVSGRAVEVEQIDIDRYGRIVGMVKVDGQSLSELIVQNGYAWVYRQYCKEKFCSDWIKSEGVARQQKKGLWASSVVVPPWEWRAALRVSKKEEDAAPVIIMGGPPKKDSNESFLSKVGKALTPESGDGGGGSSTSKAQYRCDGRTHCSQMTSCEEATFFLRNCPGTKMDGDGDGVPCERQWCK